MAEAPSSTVPTSPPQDFFRGTSSQFMDDVFQAVESYVDAGAMALEHKLLEVHGGPSMSSTQAESIHEGVQLYMDAVRTTFVKNFDKLELYAMRNVFVAPDNIAEIESKYQTHQIAQRNNIDERTDADPREIENELNALRREIYLSTQHHNALLATKKQLDDQLVSIQQLVTDLNFTQDIPRIVGPLSKHVKSAAMLRSTIGSMKELHAELESKKQSNVDSQHHPALTYDAVVSRFNKQALHVQTEDIAHLNQLL
ncbi:hypothetical protein AeNC1_007734 [Aphanomyces euteiches]|nr:hypothetical protein AeNC1_007734 [Aphanomyces euteiches]